MSIRDLTWTIVGIGAGVLAFAYIIASIVRRIRRNVEAHRELARRQFEADVARVRALDPYVERHPLHEENHHER